MEAKSLPIMLFDERALMPSFGYVFDPKWLDPFESIVSILWKLARMNRLSGQAITMQLAKSDIDPYEGVAARRSEIDLCRLHLTLGLPLKLMRDSVLPDGLQAAGGPHFRYCRKCLCRGYHSVVHQVGANKCCPVHGNMLEIACHTCGVKAAYRLNVASVTRRTDAEAVAICTAHRRPLRCRTSVHLTKRRASPLRGCDGAILRIFNRIEMTPPMRINANFRRQRGGIFPFFESHLTQLLS